MRQASTELKRLIDDGAVFSTKADITFADETHKTLESTDFYITGNSFTDGVGTSALAYGEVIPKSLAFRLVNDKEQFSDYDFINAKIHLYVTCENNAESVDVGIFTVLEPETYGDSIALTAIDDCYKGDFEYSTTLQFPQTLIALLQDSCRQCGVTLGAVDFKNKDFLVNTMPTGITHRQLWGMIAMIAGGNARFDEKNQLQIIPYDLTFFTRQGLDGGTFSTNTTPYSDGDNADGGNFTDYSSGDTYDGGTFDELNRFHIFYRGQTPTIATDDVVITGVNVTVNSDEYLSGDDRYALSVSNPLVAGNEEVGVRLIGENIINMRFRPFTIDNKAYPLAEFGDICYVSDRKGNYYQSVVTDIAFNFFGYTNVKCSADNPIRNSSSKMSPADASVKVLRKETEESFKEINENIGKLEISVKTTDEGLSAEVSRATSAEGALSTRVTLTESGLESKVSAGEVSSLIEQKADLIRLKADKLVVSSSYFSLTEYGEMTARSGTIGGFTITSSDLTNGSCRIWANNVQASYVSTNSIGKYSGSSITIGGSGANVYLGDSNTSTTNYGTMRVNGTFYNSGAGTSSYTANARLSTNGTGELLIASESSERFKHDIMDVVDSSLDPKRLYNAKVRQFKYNNDYLSMDDARYDTNVIGFIVEELVETYPIAVEHDEFGRTENWNERYMIPPMLSLIQEQHKEIEELKSTVLSLQCDLAILKEKVEV